MYLDWTHAYKSARTYAPLVAHKNYWFLAQKFCAESNARKMHYKYFTIMSKLIKKQVGKGALRLCPHAGIFSVCYLGRLSTRAPWLKATVVLYPSATPLPLSTEFVSPFASMARSHCYSRVLVGRVRVWNWVPVVRVWVQFNPPPSPTEIESPS